MSSKFSWWIYANTLGVQWCGTAPPPQSEYALKHWIKLSWKWYKTPIKKSQTWLICTYQAWMYQVNLYVQCTKWINTKVGQTHSWMTTFYVPSTKGNIAGPLKSVCTDPWYRPFVYKLYSSTYVKLQNTKLMLKYTKVRKL